MAAQRVVLVSSQAKPEEIYSQKVMFGVRRKKQTASPLSRCLGIGPRVVRVSRGFSRLVVLCTPGSWSRQYICQWMRM
ncbi:hypothetical protein TNCV_4244051 [Trichonephila clavipes]|nr:hypothetical protein TNCV_4244051 [Trichonephila clavipes]